MEPVRIITSIPLEAKPSTAIAITTISYEVYSAVDTTSLAPCTSSTTDAPATEPPEDNGLQIGLGAGIGTAIALFALGTSLFLFILRRAARLEAMASKNSSQQSFMSYEDEKHLLPTAPVELHCKPVRAELP